MDRVHVRQCCEWTGSTHSNRTWTRSIYSTARKWTGSIYGSREWARSIYTWTLFIYGSSGPSTAAVTGPFRPFRAAANGPGPFATPDQIFRDRSLRIHRNAFLSDERHGDFPASDGASAVRIDVGTLHGDVHLA